MQEISIPIVSTEACSSVYGTYVSIFIWYISAKIIGIESYSFEFVCINAISQEVKKTNFNLMVAILQCLRIRTRAVFTMISLALEPILEYRECN